MLSVQNANRVYRVQHSLVTQRALPEKFRTATSLQNSIGQRPHNNDGGGGRRRGLLYETLSEIGIKAVRIVHIALRRADPRHQHLAMSGAVHNVEAQRTRREQLLECAHVLTVGSMGSAAAACSQTSGGTSTTTLHASKPSVLRNWSALSQRCCRVLVSRSSCRSPSGHDGVRLAACK